MPRNRKQGRRRRSTGERYYIPQDVPSPLGRLYRRLVRRQKPVPSFPRIIQIQTQSGCNASCAFCPNQKTLATLTHGRMDEALFRRIVDEAVVYEPERISPFLMNEPLLDRHLPERIAYIASKKRPGTIVGINTNASKLEGEMARELLRCGLDSLAISFHGLSREAYESSMRGMDFEANLARVEAFLALWRDAPAPKPDVHVTMVLTRLIEPDVPRIKSFWAERGIEAVIRPLWNRAHAAVDQANLNTGAWEPFTRCKELVRQAFILFNGDALLCCVDWERSTVVGSLREQSLHDVWNGERYLDLRRRYFSGNVQGTLCACCKRARPTARTEGD